MTIRSRSRSKLPRAFTALSLVLGLALAELMARAILPSLVERVLYRTASESAWRLAWVERHRQGVTVYRKGIDRFDPLLGWRSRPNFRNVEPMFGSRHVSTNAKGARGRRDYPYERGEKSRIVVIGDSFAFGWGVSDDETYSALVERSLPDVEVINLGIGGYGTDQMLLMLRSEGLKYQPDLIVVGVVTADSPRNLVAFRDFAKPVFVLRGETLVLEGTPVPEPQSVLAAEPWRPKLWDLLQILGTRFEEMRGWRRERYERLTWAILKRIQTEGQAAGARVLFLFAPAGEEIFSDEVLPGEDFVRRFQAEAASVQQRIA